MTKKEKVNIIKAGLTAYAVSSGIAYVKEGGIIFLNRADDWTLRINKSLGIIDVFRVEGHLKDLDVFGSDWMFLVVGMFSSAIAVVVMKVVHYFRSEDKPKTERTPKGYKVKIGQPVKSKVRDYEFRP